MRGVDFTSYHEITAATGSCPRLYQRVGECINVEFSNEGPLTECRGIALYLRCMSLTNVVSAGERPISSAGAGSLDLSEHRTKGPKPFRGLSLVHWTLPLPLEPRPTFPPRGFCPSAFRRLYGRGRRERHRAEGLAQAVKSVRLSLIHRPD